MLQIHINGPKQGGRRSGKPRQHLRVFRDGKPIGNAACSPNQNLQEKINELLASATKKNHYRHSPLNLPIELL